MMDNKVNHLEMIQSDFQNGKNSFALKIGLSH